MIVTQRLHRAFSEPHSAPIVLGGKKSGELRLYVDVRQLNAHSIPDAYPLPRMGAAGDCQEESPELKDILQVQASRIIAQVQIEGRVFNATIMEPEVS